MEENVDLMFDKSCSEKIKKRLDDNNIRYFACDNISEFISDDEKTELINELTEKFNSVLDSLIIDRKNDPNSNGTGRRLAKMYVNEIMAGRYDTPPVITSFPNYGEHQYQGMLVVRAEINSICSHHHQPVKGVAYIGIIPGDKVIGLSKYVRIAQWYARRGQLQEELTQQIAKSISQSTGSESVAVYIEATHGCMSCRGVEQNNSTTQTTVLKGQFYDSVVKREFFDNIKLQKMSKGYE